MWRRPGNPSPVRPLWRDGHQALRAGWPPLLRRGGRPQAGLFFSWRGRGHPKVRRGRPRPPYSGGAGRGVEGVARRPRPPRLHPGNEAPGSRGCLVRVGGWPRPPRVRVRVGTAAAAACSRKAAFWTSVEGRVTGCQHVGGPPRTRGAAACRGEGRGRRGSGCGLSPPKCRGPGDGAPSYRGRSGPWA